MNDVRNTSRGGGVDRTKPKAQTRSSLQLLGDPVFGAFLSGQLMAASAMWVFNVAAVVIVFRESGSAFMAGIVGALQFLPMILSPWTGYIADRVDRRTLVMYGDTVFALTGAGIAGFLFTSDAASVSVVLLGASFAGLGMVVSAPAGQALVPSLVCSGDVAQAVALTAGCQTIARTVGPAVAMVILLSVGDPWVFVLVAVLFGARIATLRMVGARMPARTPTHASWPSRWRGRLAGAVEDSVVSGGYGSLLRDRQLLLLLLATGLACFAIDPIITLGPSMAVTLGGGEPLIGLLASAFGAGAVSSILFTGSLRHHIGIVGLSILGPLILGAGMLGFAVSVTPIQGIISVFIAGMGMLLATSALTARIHLRVDEHTRGRAMALWTLAFLGSRPLAAVANGSLADLSSPRVPVVLATFVALVSIIFVLPRVPSKFRAKSR